MVAKELGVNYHRVRRLVKWYALRQGKRPEDYVGKWDRTSAYILPDDFVDYVVEELGLRERGGRGHE